MYIASWSGGKDSCLAVKRALGQGMKISHLIHFVREPNLHGVSPELIRIQASITGIDIVQKEVPDGDFERHFKKTVKSVGMPGLKGMVFGDIYLEAHREWIERVCNDLGIEAVLPLWEEDTEALVSEFLDSGFETMVVSGKTDFIDKHWIGKKLDRDFVGYLKERGLDPCGEDGEFHTFVTGGPLFKESINVTGGSVFRKNGHWFYGIEDYELTKPPLAE
jgi:uncharacterized protein (TIGR00290 family)